MSTQPINGREAEDEFRETPDRRDFLKVAVVAAASAALPVGAAWASPAGLHQVKVSGERHPP